MLPVPSGRKAGLLGSLYDEEIGVKSKKPSPRGRQTSCLADAFLPTICCLLCSAVRTQQVEWLLHLLRDPPEGSLPGNNMAVRACGWSCSPFQAVPAGFMQRGAVLENCSQGRDAGRGLCYENCSIALNSAIGVQVTQEAIWLSCSRC